VTETLDRLCRALEIGTLAALLVLPIGALAEDAAPAPQAGAAARQTTGEQIEPTQPAGEEAASAELPPVSITQHSMRLAGADFSYSAKTGMLPLHDAQGKVLANIFYVAYMREPQETKRPITFVFNGGPGAASAYLHLGAIGPRAVEVSAKGELLGPPPRLIANDASWLDFTDLVFVDPVGTGYSRAGGGKTDDDY